MSSHAVARAEALTTTRYLLGVLLAAVSLGPVVFGSQLLCERLLKSTYRRMERGLATVVVSLSIVVVVSEFFGAFGLFRLWVIVPVLAGVGGGLILWMRPGTSHVNEWWSRDVEATGDGRDLPHVESPLWQRLATGIVVALVAGSWINRVHHSFRMGIGIVSVDTQWYHLPAATRFVQTGNLMPIQYFDGDAVTAFFPFTSELFHGLGMMYFGSDIASLVINLGWMALLLTAAWSIGRQFGVGPVTCIGAAIVVGSPGMVATQPGAALTDVVGLALLMTAVALYVANERSSRPLILDAVIGLAIGLAVGTKFTFVGPGAFIALAVIASTHRGKRFQRAGVVFLAVCATGLFWYLRNFVQMGNPLPPLKVAIGPLVLPSMHINTTSSTLSSYLFHRGDWTTYFIPGLRAVLGPAWPVIVGAVLVSCAAILPRARSSRIRWLSFVVVLCVLAYVFTPQYLSLYGRPYFFQYNLRYATPALLIGLVTLPLIFSNLGRYLFPIYAVVALATQIDPTSWPSPIGWAVFQDRVALTDAYWGMLSAVVIAAVWFGIVIVRERGVRPLRRGVLGIGTVVAVVVLLGAGRGPYLHNWYALKPGEKGSQFMTPLIDWSHEHHHQRILLSAQSFMQLQYPMVNSDQSNTVQVVTIDKGGSVGPPTTCRGWKALVGKGRFRYIAFYTAAGKAIDAEGLQDWIAKSTDAKPIAGAPFTSGTYAMWIYEVDPIHGLHACK